MKKISNFGSADSLSLRSMLNGGKVWYGCGAVRADVEDYGVNNKDGTSYGVTTASVSHVFPFDPFIFLVECD